MYRAMVYIMRGDMKAIGNAFQTSARVSNVKNQHFFDMLASQVAVVCPVSMVTKYQIDKVSALYLQFNFADYCRYR